MKGAALLAGQWLGWHHSLTPQGDWIQQQQAFEPLSAEVEVYDRLYNVYTQAYGGVRNACHELAAIRSSMIL